VRAAVRRAAPGLVALAVLPVYLATLAPGLTWANDGADGGDLITAAKVFGVAHPTGYPTYLLLARAFLHLPFGSLAYRANLLSALAAALAAGVTVALVVRGARGPRPLVWAGGLAAGLGYGLSSVLWSQAVIAEVYALHGLFVALILLDVWPGPALARPTVFWRSLHGGLGGLLFGLALGNHLTALFLLPPWLALGVWRAGRVQHRELLYRLVGLALGLAIYAYLPLRARAMPPINWGYAAHWPGFWWIISAQPYRALAFGLPVGSLLARVQAWAGLLIGQFGVLGMLAGIYGLFYGRAAPPVNWLTGWTALAYSAFAIGYGTPDSYAYLVPAFLAFAVWVGLGVAAALEALPPALAQFRPAVLCAFLLTLLLNAGGHLLGVDASRDARAEDFGRTALAGAPPGALIFTHADRDTFSLWYFHFALGQRRDVAVLVAPMLGFDWYRASLRDTYPDLVLPRQSAEPWQQAVTAANVGRAWCDAQLDGGAPLVCSP
jgi:Protein O-mannosyl-transferase TMEM260-like